MMINKMKNKKFKDRSEGKKNIIGIKVKENKWNHAYNKGNKPDAAIRKRRSLRLQNNGSK